MYTGIQKEMRTPGRSIIMFYYKRFAKTGFILQCKKLKTQGS